MLTVTVNPVHKQGTLWSTIRFITASEAVEIPVVAQWHEVNDKHDDSVPHSDPTSTTVVTGGASARVRLVAGGLLVLAIVWAVISWYPKDEDAVAIITPSPTLAQTKLPSPTTSPTAKHTQTPTRSKPLCG